MLRILADSFKKAPQDGGALCYVRMPGMSGPELAQVARRLRPDLRIRPGHSLSKAASWPSVRTKPSWATLASSAP